jgi:malate dehydrogenase (oxaloacetate-decarboxylating)
MTLRDKALELHRCHCGKISVESKVPLQAAEDLSLAYTPGVAEPCKEIAANPAAVYEYTAKGNMVAVVTDGTAVLGLGDIGPAAALPVMEGKALLFKAFAGVDAFPVCLGTKDVDKIVETVRLLEPVFGGINLEDIAAPRCFEVEERLRQVLSIPVFHDDQHGTAIVVLAALLNALKVVGKELSAVRILVNGDGAAGTAVTRLLLSVGVGDVVVCGRHGALYRGDPGLNPAKADLAAVTNREGQQGILPEVIAGKDVFIGVSAPGVLRTEDVGRMAPGAIVIAMANPVPEIWPEEALAGGAVVVGTGRSDYRNQVNNVLAFPGVFRGALDARASAINEAMKIAAAYAIAALVGDDELGADYIIPAALDRRVAPAVAAAVAKAAVDSGVARVQVDPAEVAARTRALAERFNSPEGMARLPG